MRMVQLASGVFAPADERGVVIQLLDFFTMNITLPFHRDDMTDDALGGLKVIFDFMGLEKGLPLLEGRIAVHVARRIGYASGIQFLVFKTHLNEVGPQLDVVIVHHSIPKKVGNTVFQIHYDGVLRLVSDSFFDGIA